MTGDKLQVAGNKRQVTGPAVFLVTCHLTLATFCWAEPRPLAPEDFLCKGAAGRAVAYKGKEYQDCVGGHGPQGGVRQDLLTLLNRFQARTGQTLTVSSGYRCRAHNRYSWAFVMNKGEEPDVLSRRSLHQAGAAADVYVEGVSDQKQYGKWAEELRRLAGGLGLKVWTRVYGAQEGRDPDNQHAFPYMHVHLLGVKREALPPDR